MPAGSMLMMATATLGGRASACISTASTQPGVECQRAKHEFSWS